MSVAADTVLQLALAPASNGYQSVPFVATNLVLPGAIVIVLPELPPVPSPDLNVSTPSESAAAPLIT